jgi:hypothetical protein
MRFDHEYRADLEAKVQELQTANRVLVERAAHAGPTQLLNFVRYNARRPRAVPSPACPRIHDNRIFTRNMHDTTPYILTGVLN